MLTKIQEQQRENYSGGRLEFKDENLIISGFLKNPEIPFNEIIALRLYVNSVRSFNEKYFMNFILKDRVISFDSNNDNLDLMGFLDGFVLKINEIPYVNETSRSVVLKEKNNVYNFLVDDSRIFRIENGFDIVGEKSKYISTIVRNQENSFFLRERDIQIFQNKENEVVRNQNVSKYFHKAMEDNPILTPREAWARAEEIYDLLCEKGL